MKKIVAPLFIIVFVFCLSLSSCFLLGDSEYTFKFNCSNANYIDVYPNHGGSPSYFRLSSSNPSVTVTWENEGDDYYGGFSSTSNYPSNKKAPWFSRYDALKEVIFYDY